MDLYNETCFECSALITNRYSTSFSTGIRAFHKRFRQPVYAIYGFVRCADEIVDTFHQHDKQQLITDFRNDTFKAIGQKISLNPVLNAFQLVVNKYGIDPELVEAFLLSMEMDLDKTTYDTESYSNYIFGSAEAIGLMCLKIFCEHDELLYRALYPKARSLGSAFQKVNFLRDIKADFEERGRTYFPGIDFKNFTEHDKRGIEADIQKDFDDGFEGIKKLPEGTKLGVFVAYVYYLQLFKKISSMPAGAVLQKRVRVSGTHKAALYCKALMQKTFKLI
jgi:phytoene synthase